MSLLYAVIMKYQRLDAFKGKEVYLAHSFRDSKTRGQHSLSAGDSLMTNGTTMMRLHARRKREGETASQSGQSVARLVLVQLSCAN